MRPSARITEEKIAAFTQTMRANVLSVKTPFRRANIRSIIDQVELDDAQICIIGRRTVLERLVWAEGQRQLECPVLFGSGGARKSNSCPPDSWCGRDRVLQKNATPPAFPFDPGVEWRLLARR
jgi:site-specific DNA recombinase